MRAPLLLILSLVAGCGSDGGGAPVDGATPDGGAAWAEIPWLAEGAPALAAPDFSACPAGWSALVAEGRATACEPFPGGGPLDCADGEAHLPGATGCAPIGRPCPTGDFPDDLPATGVLYVRAGAAGDGSRASPYGTIRDGMRSATAGDTVAVAPGTYDEALILRSGVTVRGACAERTLVTNTAPVAGVPVVDAQGTASVLSDLSIADTDRLGIRVAGAGRDLRLEGVAVLRARAFAIDVHDGGRLTGDGVVLRGTRGQSGSGTLGRGLQVSGGGSAELARTSVEDNAEVGVVAGEPGTTLRLEDSVVRDMRGGVDGAGGMGVQISVGAAGELSRVVFSKNRNVAFFVTDPGASAVVEDLVVRDTEAQLSDLTGGRGMAVSSGATADVRRALFERNRDVHVFISDADAAANFEDLVARDGLPQTSDMRGGAGLGAERGATLRITRGVVEDGREGGLFTLGASLFLEDVVVRRLDARADSGILGRGLVAQEAVEIDVSRLVVDRAREIGVSLRGASGPIRLQDVVVRDTQTQDLLRYGGMGLVTQLGAEVELAGALFERNGEHSVLALGEGARLVVEDVVVRDTASREADGLFGRAFTAAQGALIEGRRVDVARSQEVALCASAAGALHFTRISIRDTLPRECATSTCPGSSGGVGVAAISGGTVELTDFEITRSELCGVQVAGGGGLDLVRGEVSHALIGACVQVDDYDLARLSADVRYIDNGTNIEATSLPVPDPVRSIEPPLP